MGAEFDRKIYLVSHHLTCAICFNYSIIHFESQFWKSRSSEDLLEEGVGLDKEIENQVSHDLQKSIWCSHSPTAPKPPLRTLTSDKMTLRTCKLQQVRPLHLPYLSIENNVTRKGPNSLSSSLVTPSPCMFVNHHFYGLPGKIPIWRNWADPWGISLISMNNIILQWGTTRGTFIQQATGLSTYVCKHMQVHMYAHTCNHIFKNTQKMRGLGKFVLLWYHVWVGVH